MTILFIDNNLALDHAIRLGRETDVYYYFDWKQNYVSVENWIVGLGFDRMISPGLLKVGNWLDLVLGRDVDVVFIADSGFGPEGDVLRGLGLHVFGPSRDSDRLEFLRGWAAEKMREYGIKTPRYEYVEGYENLIEAVRNRDVFVKVSVFRGNFETQRVSNVSELHAVFEDSKLGPMRDKLVYLVSEPIEGVEVGVDLWWNGREFIRPYHLGNEVKGSDACFGRWVEESSWDEVLKRFENLLKAEAKTFRGEISFEAIWNEEGLHVLDVTPRIARPAGSLMYYSLDGSYESVVRAVALGEVPEIRLKGEWTAQVGFENPPKGWVYICSEDDWRDYVAITGRAGVLDGSIWAYADEGGGGIVFALGVGDNLEAVVEKTYDLALSFSMKADNGLWLVGGAWNTFKREYLPLMERYGFEW